MFRLALVAALATLVLADQLFDNSLDGNWATFKETHGKNYGNGLEEMERRLVWEENLKYIQKHNLEYDLGKHTYFLGMNEFTDMTHKEFVDTMLGFKPASEDELLFADYHVDDENFQAASSQDWRQHGAVTGVKNQGHCGSCWAFSTTGALEGQWKLKHGSLPNLSEQQLVDCAGSTGNLGCNGGIPSRAMQYLQSAGGNDGESSYPYQGRDGSCHFNKGAVQARVTGVRYISRGSESALTNAVSSVGPISVAIDAAHSDFMHYRGGVYNNPSCSSYRLDHAVLTVGYGSNYWLVKNSWGSSWGQGGYIQMSRNKNNQCGIATQACYPSV